MKKPHTSKPTSLRNEKELYRRLAAAFKNDWRVLARPEQLPPKDFSVWLFMAGRGSGKNWACSHYVHEQAATGAAKRIALVGATADAVRFTMVEGVSGLLAAAGNWERPTYEAGKGQLTWPSGSIARLYSADSPELLRGPEHDLAWCDELASWRRAQETWDNLNFTMRAGKRPRLIISTTPKPTKLVKDLVSREGKDGIVITRSSTYANREHLPPSFFAQLVKKYEGTRTGRQELLAELLLDTPGSLWKSENLEATRVSQAPAMQRIVVAIDPSGSGSEDADECGIIVAGLGQDGEGYVLADLSGRMTPTEWARRAIDAHHRFKADRIIAETNFGSLMVIGTIAAVDPSVPTKAITSSRGKTLRAEPVSTLSEQARVHLVGSFPELEDQMTSFTSDYDRSRDGSPDRVDALVFAITELMCNQPAGGYFRASALLVNGEPPDLPQHVDKVFIVPAASETDSVAVIFFAASEIQDIAHPLAVLDWKLVEAETALTPQWLAGALERGHALALQCARHERTRAPLLVERTPFGQVMLEFGKVYGLDVLALDDKQLGPPDLLVRATAARSFVSTGAVKICKPAHDKTVPFRGVTKNHLLSQLLAFDPENNSKQDAVEFVAAFCTAIVGELPGRRVPALPQLEASLAVVQGPAAHREAVGESQSKLPSLPEQRAAFAIEYATWQAACAAAVARIRAQSGDPGWTPRTYKALGIGEPPRPPGLVI